MNDIPAAAAMPVPPEDRLLDLHARIARQAWKLWLGYRRPAGREADIWLEAEGQIRALDSRRHAWSPADPARPCAMKSSPCG